MEVVAGVASVASVVGILNIVGHVIQGILKLKGFVHDVSTASRTVKSFLDAIENLERGLTAISDLLERAPEEWLVGAEARNTGILASQVEKCRADIDALVKEVPIHNANSLTATKSIFKKLLVASHETAYKKFHRKVERHLLGMQLSLSVLGRSYDAHILKQGSVIAEQVKTATQAQTSFHRLSMLNFGKLDESFATSLNPVSSQLDRLERSSQKSGASMSSLASDMSRMLEILSSSSALATSARSDEGSRQLVETDTKSAGSRRAKTKNDRIKLSQQRQRLSTAQMEWSCDFLPGIEAAFSASGSICLYCGDDFDDDWTEWSIRGRHLVDEHRYGECNVLLSYDSEEKFAQHIQQFHHCSLNYDGFLSKKFLISHFQRGRKKGFHRGIESKEQYLTDDFHDINSRRWCSLFDNGRVSNAIHDHCGGIKVPFRVFAPGKPPVQRPLEPDLHNALSAEGCNVDGLMIVSTSPPWSSMSRIGDEVTMPCFSSRDSNGSSGVEKPHLPPLTVDSLVRLWVRSSWNRSALATAGVMNENKRINLWLQEMLTSSSTTRTILFHTLKTADPYFSNVNTWLERVLEFWESDEAAIKADEPDSYSDGALDSRGSPEIRNVTDHESATQFPVSQASQEEMIHNKRSEGYDPISAYDAFGDDIWKR